AIEVGVEVLGRLGFRVAPEIVGRRTGACPDEKRSQGGAIGFGCLADLHRFTLTRDCRAAGESGCRRVLSECCRAVGRPPPRAGQAVSSRSSGVRKRGMLPM